MQLSTLTHQQRIYGAIFGVLGTVWEYMFGSANNDALIFLAILVVVDYITGNAASMIEGKGLSSKVGRRGILRKALMFVLIMICHQADKLLGLSVLSIGVTYFYLANELLSIVENYGRCGLPVPKKVRTLITVLKNKAEEDIEEENKKEDGQE